MLARKGVHEGHVAAGGYAGKKRTASIESCQAIAYTEPEVAWVGLTEKKRKKRHHMKPPPPSRGRLLAVLSLLTARTVWPN